MRPNILRRARARGGWLPAGAVIAVDTVLLLAPTKSNLVGPNNEILDQHLIVRRGKRGVGRITTARHQRSAVAARVIAGVERVPLSAQIDFKEGAEILRSAGGRYANLAQVACGIPRRYVQASTKGQGQMIVISAHTFTVLVDFVRSFCRARVLVP